MSDRMTIRLTLASLVLVAGIASAQPRPPLSQAAPAPQAPAPTPPPTLNWEFRTEQHWLMTIGAEAVVQLITAGPRPAVVLSLDPHEADAPVHFGLRVDGRSTGVVLAVSPALS